MINILSFDTSTEACSAAIQFQSKRAQRFEIAPRQHAELLLSMIETLFIEMQCELNDLDAIAFGQGPGSFMGVRIAAAIAQALAFAAKKPVIATSTLQALAQQAYLSYRYERVIAAWDARMGEVYWAAYQLNSNECMQTVVADALSSPQELQLFLESKEFKEHPYQLVGNAFNVYQSEFTMTHENHPTINSEIYPTAEALLSLAEQAFRQQKTITAIEAQPLYLRNEVAKEPKPKF